MYDDINKTAEQYLTYEVDGYHFVVDPMDYDSCVSKINEKILKLKPSETLDILHDLADRIEKYKGKKLANVLLQKEINDEWAIAVEPYLDDESEYAWDKYDELLEKYGRTYNEVVDFLANRRVIE